MAYQPPHVAEMLIAQRDGVKVYAQPSTSAQVLLTNSQYNDHSLRPFLKGDPVGRVLEDKTYVSQSGTEFVKIQYWTWEREGDNVFGFKIGGNANVQIFHEGYVSVDDEPEWWIRQTWQLLNAEQTEQEDKADEVTAYLSGLSGVPTPTEVFVKTSSDGIKSTWLTFANGYEVEFEAFKKLAPETKRTLTTRDPTKSSLLDTNNGGNSGKGGDGSGSSLFTTTNVLIGVGVLCAFGVLLVIILRKKK